MPIESPRPARRTRAFLWLATRPRAFVQGRVYQAAQAFVGLEASSGIVLLAAALAAIAWANSPWGDSYFDLWHTAVSFDAGAFELDHSLLLWVNDGLMTLFFFLVGLEIKRELVHGELSQPRKAMLPAAAAIGGMVVPAVIYAGFNVGGEGLRGWGMPMATDIAFALGLLSLFGRRVPFGVKVFLLALAISDDIGAILVIAVFYTSQVNLGALAASVLILGLIVGLNRRGMRNVDVYVVIGFCLWFTMLESGIHATLAGVVLGLLTPASPFFNSEAFADSAETLVSRYRRAGDVDARHGLLAEMEDLSHGTEAPLDRLERKLHPWVSYGVVPIFALANAGVPVSGEVLSRALDSSIAQGVFVGLVVGKPLGILAATWIAVRLRVGELPAGATWTHILGIGLLGGVGFTVSLLISGLAFSEGSVIDSAKLGILGGSVIAGLAGFIFLYATTRKNSHFQPEARL